MVKYILVILFGFGWIGAAVAQSDQPQSTPSLTDFITLEESTEADKILSLQFGVPPQDIDVNSVVLININTAGFYQSVPDGVAAKMLTPHQRELLSYSGKLRNAFQFIEKSLDLSIQLQEMVNQNKRDSQEFKATSQELQNIFNIASNEILIPYYELLKSSPRLDYVKHGEKSRKDLNKAILNPNATAMLDQISQEITWITLELQNAGASVKQQASSMALNLIAYYSQDGEQKYVHLPHYDDIPAGAIVNLNKLNTVPSPEEMAKLKKLYEEAQNISVDLNKIEDKREALKKFLNISLNNAGIDIETLQAAAKELLQELERTRTHDWVAEMDAAKTRIKTALETEVLTDERRAALQHILELVSKLQTAVSTASATYTQLEKSVKDLVSRLDNVVAQLRDDPLDGLLAIADQVSASKDAYDAVKTQLDAMLKTGQGFGKDISTLAAEVKALFNSIDPQKVGETMAAEIDDIFAQLKLEHLDRIRDAYNKTEQALNSVIDSVKKLDPTTRDSINNYVATFIEPPEMSFFVPLDKAKNTYLDIRTIAIRKEGFQVTLQAQLYPIDTSNGVSVVNKQKVLDEEAQQFQLLRYGLYGDYSVGLAYTESQDILPGQTDKTQSFQPTVSWIVRYRGWREPNQPARYYNRWYKTMGIGVHTVSLDLNNDNEMEIGMGVTLSIFNELFQIGYGRDLSLDENYYFIATRLLEFGNKR